MPVAEGVTTPQLLVTL